MSSKIKVDTIENVAGSGNVSLGSGHNLVVPGNITGQGTAAITSNATVGGTLGVTGASTFNGNMELSATSPVLTVTATDTNQGSIVFKEGSTNKFNVSAVGSSDVFQIYNYNTSSQSMVIDASSRVTMPNQPSFAVYGVNNNTGFNMIDGTVVKLANWQTAFHNTGSHFNTTTGVFTAPVAGKYFFYLQVMFRMNTNTYISDLLFSFKKNGSVYINTDIGYNDDGNGDGWNTETMSTIIDLNANDTVDAHYFIASTSHSTGAATNWSIYNGQYTQFHGHLLG